MCICYSDKSCKSIYTVDQSETESGYCCPVYNIREVFLWNGKSNFFLFSLQSFYNCKWIYSFIVKQTKNISQWYQSDENSKLN